MHLIEIKKIELKGSSEKVEATTIRYSTNAIIVIIIQNKIHI